MTLGFALAGLLAGALLNWAADGLPRWAYQPPHAPSVLRSVSRRWGHAASYSNPKFRLALWVFLRSLANKERLRDLSKPLWIAAAVEFLMLLLFGYLGIRYGLSWNSLFLAFTGSLFILVALIDLQRQLVLNVLILPAAAAALLIQSASPAMGLLPTLVGGGFGFAIFALTALVRPGQLGGGDIKLATFIGLLFGFPNALWALMIGVFAGGVAAAYLILARRSNPKSQMPYAPFLCLGALLLLYVNPPLTFR